MLVKAKTRFDIPNEIALNNPETAIAEVEKIQSREISDYIWNIIKDGKPHTLKYSEVMEDDPFNNSTKILQTITEIPAPVIGKIEYCARCGAAVESFDSYCWNCGMNLKEVKK